MPQKYQHTRHKCVAQLLQHKIKGTLVQMLVKLNGNPLCLEFCSQDTFNCQLLKFQQTDTLRNSIRRTREQFRDIILALLTTNIIEYSKLSNSSNLFLYSNFISQRVVDYQAMRFQVAKAIAALNSPQVLTRINKLQGIQ